MISLFIGSAVQGKVGGWMYYILVNELLVSNKGYDNLTDDVDVEKIALDKGIEYLKKNHQDLIDFGTKIRVHTSYNGDIDLPSYEKVNNEHFLQTNANIGAMETIKSK